MDCGQILFTGLASAELINLWNELGIRYNPSQLRHLNRKKAELDGKTNAATSAEQLISSLQNMKGVAFLTVVYDPTEGLLLSMTSTKITKSKKDIKLNPTLYGVDQLCKKQPELRNLYKSSLSSTAASGGKKRLLLVLLFATSEELRLFRMFPDFCCCDTTFGTNNEKQELFTLASLDANNRAFNCLCAYVPNSQACVFNILFKHCLRMFWGESVCDRVRLMLTDGCTQEYLSFINNMGEHNTFPNAQHGLCNFHLLHQGYNTHVKALFYDSKFATLETF